MSPDIHELFDDAADDSGRKPLDATRLVAKGRRKVRIRQYGVLSGAVVLVAAAVLGFGELRTLSSDGPGPIPPAYTPTVPVPTTPTPTPKAVTVTPTGKATTVVPTSKAPTVVPTDKATVSVPTTGGTSPRTRTPATGTEVIRKLSYADGVQRCRQRMEAEYGDPGTPNPPEAIDEGQGLQYGMYVTDLLPMKLRDGSSAYCSVPGETRPSYDKPSGDPRGACGELTWLDAFDALLGPYRQAAGPFRSLALHRLSMAGTRDCWSAPTATRHISFEVFSDPIPEMVPRP